MKPAFSLCFILLLSLVFTTKAKANNRLDSVGIITIEGRTYVVHAVDSGETLYSLSKRYRSTIEGIREANDFEDVLKSGILIRVPLGTADLSSSKKPVKERIPSFHVVKEEETLYSISKSRANLSLDDLRMWNKLENDIVRIGDSIIVGWKGGQAAPAPNAPEVKKQVISKVVPPAIDLGKPVESKGPELKASALIEQDSRGTKLPENKKYALHKTIPKGTIVKIINPSNQRIVFVKVIGRIADDGSTVDMIISKSAASQIKMEYRRIKVQMVYSLKE